MSKNITVFLVSLIDIKNRRKIILNRLPKNIIFSLKSTSIQNDPAQLTQWFNGKVKTITQSPTTYLYCSLSHYTISYYIKKLRMFRNFLLSATATTAFFLTSKDKSECCGIIGILSSTRSNVSDSLSMGVELLKNRGYDSAGIVTFHEENATIKHQMIRHAEEGAEKLNCIERLVSQVNSSIVKSFIGIGHTRWATCGQKIVKNAHPHFDNSQNIFIVHNGIISSHAEIKQKQLSDIEFKSQTDTEIIPQLLGKFRKEGLSMVEALRKVQYIINQSSQKSQWGIVIMDKTQPNKLWTCTNGSPILVGMNDTQIFVASEPIAFKKQANNFFVTKDGEIFELQIPKIKQLQAQMLEQERLRMISVEEKSSVLAKPPEGFKTFYSYELRQQGQIQFEPDFERVKAVPFDDYLSFIACGSSLYAALAAQHFYKKLKTFKKIGVFDPVELYPEDICEKETVVLISQSGETKDLSNIVADCKKIKGVKTIGIINVEGSTIARKVDYPIYIKVGREASVAATKSMFHQTLNLIELATEVAQKKKSASQTVIGQIREELRSIPTLVQQTIKMTEEDCQDLAHSLYKKQSVYLLAMRETLGIAKQAALKIKELNYIHAEALGACEMKHGPIALIESNKVKQTVVFLFVLDNQTYETMMNAVDQMRSRSANIVLVTDCKQKIMSYYKKKQEQKKSMNSQTETSEDPERLYTFINIPNLKHCAHLLSLIPMQLLVEKIAVLKEINPDMPRNLAKTVTV